MFSVLTNLLTMTLCYPVEEKINDLYIHTLKKKKTQNNR